MLSACKFIVSPVLTYDDSPMENDGQLIGSPYEDDRSDAKMLKSVHGEIPKQSAPIPKEELQEPARMLLSEGCNLIILVTNYHTPFFKKISSC